MRLTDFKPQERYEKYFNFNGKILLLGFGGVGQAILPLILRHVNIDPRNIVVIEKDNHQGLFDSKYKEYGITYIIEEIVKENFNNVMSSTVSSGDLVINLSLNIDGIEIVSWCLSNNVFYIDTSIERWPDKPDETIINPADRTLYHTHQKIRKATSKWKNNSATSVVTHGANPGLVSHFVKAALLDIANSMQISYKIPQSKHEWARLMQATGTKTIHIAEKDTQILKDPKEINEFVNTWSCEGFWAEGRAPAEMGWGTHENVTPRGGHIHSYGPGNAAYLDKPGVSVLLKSWVPRNGQFNGFCVQHSESITISDYFTLYENNKPVYRPTVHYVYQPCDAALVSVHEFRGKELRLQDHKRIAKNEIISGMDELGVLLLGHGRTAWWYGSQLSIEESRKLIPEENPTVIQVAAAMLGALVWMMKNPNKGYVEPDEIPFNEVIQNASPYLGTIASVQSNWTPILDRNSLFEKDIDIVNPWSFENFRIKH